MKKIASFLIPLILMACTMSPAMAEQDYGLMNPTMTIESLAVAGHTEPMTVESLVVAGYTEPVAVAGYSGPFKVNHFDKMSIMSKSGNHRTM